MMKNLPVCSLILVVLASGIYGHPIDEVEKQICIPGEQTQEDCNTCTCSVDGTRMVCTRMGCRRMSDEHLNASGPLLPHQNNLMHRTKRG
ncbi:protease inhibitors-like [Diprion similis]|uniref:protease inhibitors-like n=1 Tax=Diprion similis TaxID=362088 RepID=UPI001EF7C6FF|nr:protease inhibitors-like [Diprion similis]